MVKFNRCLYAQLVQQQYEAPRNVPMPEPDSPGFPSASLGIKLTAGFEILCTQLAGMSPSPPTGMQDPTAAAPPSADSNGQPTSTGKLQGGGMTSGSIDSQNGTSTAPALPREHATSMSPGCTSHAAAADVPAQPQDSVDVSPRPSEHGARTGPGCRDQAATVDVQSPVQESAARISSGAQTSTSECSQGQVDLRGGRHSGGCSMEGSSQGVSSRADRTGSRFSSGQDAGWQAFKQRLIALGWFQVICTAFSALA